MLAALVTTGSGTTSAARSVEDRGVSGFLRVLAWTRLALAQVLVVVAPLIPSELVPALQPGLLVLVFVAVLASSGLILLLGSPDRAERLAWLLCCLDVALVTAVVAATGGTRSLFTFLYVPAVTVATVLLSRVGGLVLAAASTALYADLVLGPTLLPLSRRAAPSVGPTALEVLTIFVNGGTLLIVAVVAGSLAERFRSTRHQLEVERQTVEHLAAFREILLHSVGMGFIAFDEQGVVTAINQAAAGITGLRLSEPVGRPWRNFLGGEPPWSAIQERPGTPLRQELTLTRSDGTPVPVRLTFSALRARGGHSLGYVAVCEDLTEIRAMEERVRQADRLATLGRLAANIAHEIRNPLASISGALEILSLDTAVPQERRSLTQIVLRESDRLDRLIGDLIEYAQPAPLRRELVDVGGILDEIVHTLNQWAVSSGLQVACDHPPQLRWRVDPQRLRQAVLNLCSNAVDAMEKGGELQLTAAEDARGLAITVSDSGDPIATEHLPHIFEPFYPTRPTGSGLGLALVHRIARDHGGDVEVATAPGKGTTVTLRLPHHDG